MWGLRLVRSSRARPGLACLAHRIARVSLENQRLAARLARGQPCGRDQLPPPITFRPAQKPGPRIPVSTCSNSPASASRRPPAFVEPFLFDIFFAFEPDDI